MIWTQEDILNGTILKLSAKEFQCIKIKKFIKLSLTSLIWPKQQVSTKKEWNLAYGLGTFTVSKIKDGLEVAKISPTNKILFTVTKTLWILHNPWRVESFF